MKKILLGTTAIVAMGAFSAEAMAADQPVDISVGGFANQYVTYSNHDETGANADTMKIGQWSDSEVHFDGAATFDNGLTVTVGLQREADSGNNGGDRSYVTVSSDNMGAVTLGDASTPTDGFAVRAPIVGPLDFGDSGDNLTHRATANGTASAFAATANDITDNGDNGALQMNYVSPSFSGVTVYGQYVAGSGVSNNSRAAARSGTNDQYGVGVAYENEIAGAAVAADLATIHTNGTVTHNRLGLSAGMAGVTVAGSYNWYDDDTSSVGAALDSNSGRAWELGVGYTNNAYSVSAAYANSQSDGTVATAGSNEDTSWLVGAGYDMGAGVGLVGQYAKYTHDAEGTTAKMSGSVITAGIEVSF